MRTEIQYMRRLGVYSAVAAEDRPPGARIIPTRWVLVNKGDARRLDVRARLVVAETRSLSRGVRKAADTFAACPPLAALKAILSLCVRLDGDQVIGVYDVSRAHIHSDLDRVVFANLPPQEDQAGAYRVVRMHKA